MRALVSSHAILLDRPCAGCDLCNRDLSHLTACLALREVR